MKVKILYSALMTVKKLTSVELKRTFSAGGNFTTNIESRPNDNTLTVPVYLKRYFQEQKKQ